MDGPRSPSSAPDARPTSPGFSGVAFLEGAWPDHPDWHATLPSTQIGRSLVYLGDGRNPFSVYDLTRRRSRDGPERFLDGYRGYLQTDAFTGYDRICAGPG